MHILALTIRFEFLACLYAQDIPIMDNHTGTHTKLGYINSGLPIIYAFLGLYATYSGQSLQYVDECGSAAEELDIDEGRADNDGERERNGRVRRTMTTRRG